VSLYSSPEALAANPPETWRVLKRGERSWGLHIDTSYEHPAETFTTKRAAEAERDNPQSRMRREVERERLWYDGVTPAGWKTYEQCKAEQERLAKWNAERAAKRAADANYKKEQWP
jgi:hypothetical protein